MRDHRQIVTETSPGGYRRVRSIPQDRSKYSPNDKGTSVVGPPKPNRNHGQADE